jgi:excisionase family DNA binding protein
MIIPEVIPEKAMFKPTEVAAMFSVQSRAIYSWINHGKINAIKVCGSVVRIPREAILEFINMGGKGFVNTHKRAVTSRMVAAMRGRIRSIICGNAKADTSMRLLGCTREAFREHIEKRFKPGMTWDNYGLNGWTVDHIIPCAQFDLSDPDHQRVCFHYTNLQPLWHIENIKKGKKYTRRNIRKVIRISHAIS